MRVLRTAGARGADCRRAVVEAQRGRTSRTNSTERAEAPELRAVARSTMLVLGFFALAILAVVLLIVLGLNAPYEISD
jgi:hypothetical protein